MVALVAYAAIFISFSKENFIRGNILSKLRAKSIKMKPASEINVMAASAGDNVQIEIENNQESAKKDAKVFNKVNYYFLRQQLMQERGFPWK